MTATVFGLEVKIGGRRRRVQRREHCEEIDVEGVRDTCSCW